MSINGSGGGPTRFGLTISSTAGGAAIDYIQILLNGALDGNHACYLSINPPENGIYLMPDLGTGWLNPVAPGSDPNPPLSNSQCLVGARNSTVQVQGNSVTVNLELSFLPPFIGPQNIYVQATDLASGEGSGWQVLGTYTPYPLWTNDPPQVMSSISGMGMSGTFTFHASDRNGYLYIDHEYVLITPGSPAWVNGCNFLYYPRYNHLYLVGEDGGLLEPYLVPGTAGTQSNSQCTIDASAAPNNGGNDVDLPLTITFKAGFTGLKNVWQEAMDRSYHDTGWQPVGSWTVASSTPSFDVSYSNLGAASIQAAATATYQLTISPVNGFNAPVSFSVSPPSGVTVTFNPASITGSGSTTMTVSTTSSTVAGTYNLGVTASGGGVNRSLSVPLIVQVTLSPSSALITVNTQQVIRANTYIPNLIPNWSVVGLGSITDYQSDGSTFAQVTYHAPATKPTNTSGDVLATDLSGNQGITAFIIVDGAISTYISPGSTTHPSIGGSGAISIQTTGNWTASTADNWIHLGSTGGHGYGWLMYTVAPTSASRRDDLAININGLYFGITQNGPGSSLGISTSSLPNGTVGQAYSQQLTASGGTPSYTWSTPPGSLPPGFNLSASGMLSGTPTAESSYSFNVQVTDSAAPVHDQAGGSLSLTISSAVSTSCAASVACYNDADAFVGPDETGMRFYATVKPYLVSGSANGVRFYYSATIFLGGSPNVTFSGKQVASTGDYRELPYTDGQFPTLYVPGLDQTSMVDAAAQGAGFGIYYLDIQTKATYNGQTFGPWSKRAPTSINIQPIITITCPQNPPIVGQQVTCTSTESASAEVTQRTWSVMGGNPVTDYVWAADGSSATVTAFQNSGANIQSMKFTSGGSVTVTYSATYQNGTTRSTQTNMTVLAPQVQPLADHDYATYVNNDPMQAIQFRNLPDNVPSGWVLSFGHETGGSDRQDGINFYAQVTVPQGGAGEIAYVQLVNWNFHVQNIDGTSYDVKNTSGTWLADPPVPYNGERGIVQVPLNLTGQIATGDLPELPGLTDNQVSVYANFNFQMFLIYLPPGACSIWVPLQEIDWGWSATVEHAPGTTWQSVANNPWKLGTFPSLSPSAPTVKNPGPQLPVWNAFPQ
jgi:hypothetical protein